MAGYCIRVGVSGMTGSFMFLGVIQGVGVSAHPGPENTRAPWRRGSDSRLRACHTPPRHIWRRYRFFCRFRRPLLRSPSGLGAPLSQRGIYIPNNINNITSITALQFGTRSSKKPYKPPQTLKSAFHYRKPRNLRATFAPPSRLRVTPWPAS